ncbi:MAG: hypothetical protein IPJ94_26710 [Chloroflexi bacterium]|nr:hypothetical protein [Chloroflexota bacterium]
MNSTGRPTSPSLAGAEVGLSLTYQQVSPCAGVFTVQEGNGRSSHQGQTTPMNDEIEEAHSPLHR